MCRETYDLTDMRIVFLPENENNDSNEGIRKKWEPYMNQDKKNKSVEQKKSPDDSVNRNPSQQPQGKNTHHFMEPTSPALEAAGTDRTEKPLNTFDEFGDRNRFGGHRQTTYNLPTSPALETLDATGTYRTEEQSRTAYESADRNRSQQEPQRATTCSLVEPTPPALQALDTVATMLYLAQPVISVQPTISAQPDLSVLPNDSVDDCDGCCGDGDCCDCGDGDCCDGGDGCECGDCGDCGDCGECVIL